MELDHCEASAYHLQVLEGFNFLSVKNAIKKVILFVLSLLLLSACGRPLAPNRPDPAKMDVATTEAQATVQLATSTAPTIGLGLVRPQASAATCNARCMCRRLAAADGRDAISCQPWLPLHARAVVQYIFLTLYKTASPLKQQKTPRAIGSGAKANHGQAQLVRHPPANQNTPKLW